MNRFFKKYLRSQTLADCRVSIAAGVGCWLLVCSIGMTPALAQDGYSNHPEPPPAGQILIDLPSPDAASRPEDGSTVQSAVFHDSIPELPDVVATQSGVVESLKQNG